MIKRDINLITEEFTFDPFKEIKPKLLAVWLVCLILALGWAIGTRITEIKTKKTDLAQLNTRLSQLSAEEGSLTQFIQKNGVAVNEESFKEIIKWKEMLSGISSMVPEGAWLKSFEGGVNKEIKFIGFANSHAPITLFLSRLERQPLFSQIRLTFTQKGESPEDRFIHFEMTGKIN